MSQWLVRGTCIDENNRIKKMLYEKDNWQLYETSNEQNVLAVNDELFSFWLEKCDLPGELFNIIEDYHVLCSAKGYVIASLSHGPFPEKETQVIAFVQTIADYAKSDVKSFSDGVYIEEYSILLPGDTDSPAESLPLVAGRWLTGGIGISVESFDRFSDIVSWIPKERLIKYVSQIGVKLDCADFTDFVRNSADRNDNIERKFSLIGRPELEEFFEDNIIDIVTNSEQYRRMGIDFPGATILYGPPGCGKTYAVDRLTEFLDWPRFDIDATSIASPYIHDTSKKIGEVFNSAIKCAPSVIVIDEMEAFLTDRQATGAGDHHTEEVAEFLRRIPEAISKNVLILAMTNLIDDIDPAILRRGRFDHVIEVKMPGAEEIKALLDNRFKDLPIAEDVDSKNISEMLDGHPMSDVTFVIREAGRFAVKKKLNYINKQCFVDAIDKIGENEKPKKQIGFRV